LTPFATLSPLLSAPDENAIRALDDLLSAGVVVVGEFASVLP